MKMSKRNKLLMAVFIFGLLITICVAAVVRIVSRANFGNDDVMCQGITIDGIDIGGMTKEEAEKAVDEHINKLGERIVVVNINNDTVETTFNELGFYCTSSGYIDEAYNIGKTGNFFERLFQLETISDEDLIFNLEYTVDNDAIRDFVSEKCTIFDVRARNSKLRFKNGKFSATKDRQGLKLSVDETADKIIEGINNSINAYTLETQESETQVLEPLTIEAVVNVKEPRYTREMVSKCKDLIGSYSTSFATSTAARASNVQTAAKYINGTILYPNKTFSTIKVIKDRTEANGYKSAAEYSSGKVVDGIGGGVCQVSTTLYNAVLNAELEVVERSPHSMVVGYVEVSRDAAIAGDYKDFKFKNNTDAPVYIAASAEGGVLSFKIYGAETRDKNRTIEFEPEILETIQPGADVITEDKSLPSSYRAVTQSAHVGYRAKLWKIVYVDGVETERIQVNSSTYSAEPQYVTVGNQGGSSTPNPTKDPEETQKPKQTQKPKATSEPKPTQKPEPKPTQEPTPKPTIKPTEAPEQVPTEAPEQSDLDGTEVE